MGGHNSVRNARHRHFPVQEFFVGDKFCYFTIYRAGTRKSTFAVFRLFYYVELCKRRNCSMRILYWYLQGDSSSMIISQHAFFFNNAII